MVNPLRSYSTAYRANREAFGTPGERFWPAEAANRGRYVLYLPRAAWDAARWRRPGVLKHATLNVVHPWGDQRRV